VIEFNHPIRGNGAKTSPLPKNRKEAIKMFPQNYWYVMCESTELGDQPFARTILNMPLVAYRTPSGEAVVLEDYCPHRGLPLSRGRCEGEGIRCGYHGMLVDRDGSCKSMPGQPNIGRLKGVRRFAVVEKFGFVWVWHGAADAADAAKLPPLPWGEGSGWTYGGGVYRIACNYQFIIDNLMDLTHEKYVHPTSLGQKEIDETKPEASVEGDEVYFKRWMINVKPAPFWAAMIDTDKNCDRWQICRYVPPSNVLIDVGVAVTGTGAPQGDRSQGITGLVINLMTPETETSAFHFWGMARNFKTADEALTASIRKNQGGVVLEDNVVLEAQQQSVLAFPDKRLVSLDIDRGGSQARKIIERICRGQEPRQAAAPGQAAAAPFE
jgi:vanillate O-demethylase monooxygenase subunit